MIYVVVCVLGVVAGICTGTTWVSYVGVFAAFAGGYLAGQKDAR